MGYQPARNMGISSFAIAEAVRQLCENNQDVSVEDIALKIGCSTKTVRRNLPVLLDSGMIVKPGNQNFKRAGYRYSCGKAKADNGTAADGC